MANEAGNTEQSATPQRFLARQPIFNRQRQVVGYELLFRTGWQNFFAGEKQEATRQTLDNYLCMGIESLANGQLAFLNCTYEALVNRWVSLLPPETTVLEILEDIEPTPELIEACVHLHGQGYRFALDDFVPRSEWAPLLQIASYVKVDFQVSDAAQRREIGDELVGRGPPGKQHGVGAADFGGDAGGGDHGGQDAATEPDGRVHRSMLRGALP